MAKQNRHLPSKPKEDTQSNYYDLKVDAVNDLVDALNEDPHKPLTEEQIKDPNTPSPYKIDKFSRIPTWIKVAFIKFWIGGALCFFVLFGIGYYIENFDDLFFLSGIILGVVTDLMINSAFLHFESDKKEFHPYMMLPISCKKIWTMFVNIPYGILIIYTIYLIYQLLNSTIANGNLQVEPLLFGLCYLIVDTFYISIKNLIVMLVRKIKKTKNPEL